ncbi:C4-dicarboxylate ABC transporter [Chryseobacterium koreense CCUG 49689]|uniref:C4-dicarboxylate ABC transporter n=1 Tax=Chryseobacterium koreense CCUG 49689 TaxID=1304281 RepID=A0A0J7IX01_9FLAO|nr:C4-dicarboxylate ABC transporter [Chryseobacterium koreense CCUG 49689]
MFNWLSLLAGILYIVLGVFVIVKSWFFGQLEAPIAYGLGGLLLLYGSFRIIRAIYRIKSRGDES